MMEITSNSNQDLTDEIKSSSTVYTQEELNKAVQEEREACISILKNYVMPSQFTIVGDVLEFCIEAIRQRGEK